MNHSEFLIKKNIYASPNQGFSLQLENFTKAFFAQLFPFCLISLQKKNLNGRVLMVEIKNALSARQVVKKNVAFSTFFFLSTESYSFLFQICAQMF